MHERGVSPSATRRGQHAGRQDHRLRLRQGAERGRDVHVFPGHRRLLGPGDSAAAALRHLGGHVVLRRAHVLAAVRPTAVRSHDPAATQPEDSIAVQTDLPQEVLARGEPHGHRLPAARAGVKPVRAADSHRSTEPPVAPMLKGQHRVSCAT
ncbi:hypothetical protein ON010_g10780 [Phytophthora cinnamomi]|nr:hypothetical protein ON010_g10780 [Phytophthora cinnamomi]